MGWYCYLEDQLQVPFKARCIAQRRVSPLKEGEEVGVEGMAPSEECLHDMFVQVRWSDRTFSVPLSQLKAIEADDDTQEAIEDWHYWVVQGYGF
jgi:hypothetical protein